MTTVAPFHLSPQERYARGRAARREVPRTSHADWEAQRDRPDPIDLLKEQERTRVPELVPIRHGRMAAAPRVGARLGSQQT